MKARIVDGQIVEVGVPRTGRLANGQMVSNYDRLPDQVLHSEGWRSIVDNGPPEHDPETESLETNYEVQSNGIPVVRYTVVAKDLSEDPLVERVAVLEQQVRDLIKRVPLPMVFQEPDPEDDPQIPFDDQTP